MSDTKTTTTPRAKRSRPGSPLEFEKPKMSCVETEERLVRAVGIRDPDFLSTFINQVVAVGDLGEPSDDHEINPINQMVAWLKQFLRHSTPRCMPQS